MTQELKNEIENILDKRVKYVKTGMYTRKEFNCFLVGLLKGLKLGSLITKEEKEEYWDKYEM